jgi:hypothetical protein
LIIQVKVIVKMDDYNKSKTMKQNIILPTAQTHGNGSIGPKVAKKTGTRSKSNTRPTVMQMQNQNTH